MSNPLVVFAGAGERIDLLVKGINNVWSPIVWFAVVGYALYFTYKELESYTENSESKQQKLNDILDERTFEKAAMPLMIQLDAQVATFSRTAYDEALEAEGEPFSDPISKYEEIRLSTLRDMDISSTSEALELTESLREASKAARHKKACDKLYRLILRVLKIAYVSLILNIVAGIALLVTSIAFTDKPWSRYVFVVWATLFLLNSALALIYATANITIDGYRRRG